MSEPRTEAGKRLLASTLLTWAAPDALLDSILAIEAEAAREAVAFGTALLHDAHLAAQPVPSPILLAAAKALVEAEARWTRTYSSTDGKVADAAMAVLREAVLAAIAGTETREPGL